MRSLKVHHASWIYCQIVALPVAVVVVYGAKVNIPFSDILGYNYIPCLE